MFFVAPLLLTALSISREMSLITYFSFGNRLQVFSQSFAKYIANDCNLIF
ncbi:hypothetical protein O59_003029 [Cellvibrio sp. BR]|nr:hypothetical protein O59_003029 [Cellvibrio sp. BR]